MQIKIYTIPILGGELLNDELNTFLRAKKVLQVENQLVVSAQTSFWCFCIKYVDDRTIEKDRVKVDYRQVLDEASFKRFSRMREIRKQIAQAEAIPAYAVFTDEELAELAKIEELSLTKMRSVQGIGEKKLGKYGQHFLLNPEVDEKG